MAGSAEARNSPSAAHAGIGNGVATGKDLQARAVKSFRRAAAHHWRVVPEPTSVAVVERDGLRYAVVRQDVWVLDVLRVLKDGRLKRLKRPPPGFGPWVSAWAVNFA